MSEQDRLARELRLAAERGEIIAQYQPQVDLRDGLLVALEALSRWRHPRLGVIPPREFIPLAEATGAMIAIGDAMLQAACRYGATLVRARSPDRGRGERGRRPALRGAFPGARRPTTCEASGMPAALLTLELTETRPVPAEAAEALAGIRAIGVGVSVDDVRTVGGGGGARARPAHHRAEGRPFGDPTAPRGPRCRRAAASGSPESTDSARWPRGSRRVRNSSRCASSGSTVRRATCSVGPCRRAGSRPASRSGRRQATP